MGQGVLALVPAPSATALTVSESLSDLQLPREKNTRPEWSRRSFGSKSLPACYPHGPVLRPSLQSAKWTETRLLHVQVERREMLR